MSSRITTIGAEFSATVSNNARVTSIGAEFSATVFNNSRVTSIGVEYSYKELVQAHGLGGYLRDQVVNHIFRSATLAKPSALYLALYTTPPNASGGGVEVSGGSYARASFVPYDGYWSAPTAGNGITRNLVDIVFPTPTANWGLTCAWGIFDAATGGNLLAFGTFTVGIFVASGSNPRFVTNALSVTLA